MRRLGVFVLLSVVGSVPLDLKSQDGVSMGFQPVPINPVDNINDIIQNGVNKGALLSGQVFKTVKRYHCSLSRSDGQANELLYGTNGWTFPQQDVNLTLSYPTANNDIQEFGDYVIIGYEIILFSDGLDSAGFITAGGLLRGTITLNFIVSSVTMLSYEFRLYGVPPSQATSTNANYKMC